MKYLLDTNVVSELMKPEPDPKVLAWVNENNAEICLSALVLAELAFGVESLPEGKRKAALAKEVQFIQEDYCDSILPFDDSAAWEWARYTQEACSAGHAPPLLDSLIAATAKAWGLQIATRNVEDFPLVGVVNPFTT